MNFDQLTDDMLMVATAYRQELMAGRGDVAAYAATLEAYLAKQCF